MFKTKKGLFSILYLLPFCLAANSKNTLNGFIRDAETGENLVGASIWIESLKVGTVTNLYGFYSITLPEGKYQVRFSYVGYQSNTLDVDLGEKDVTIDVTLKPTKLEEIVIESDGEYGNRIESTQMGLVEVNAKQIKSLPTLLGEVDVLKSIQLLPGIQSGNEGTSGIYVRGGGPDQNLILLDGVPVYNASHLFGFLSVFNADAINNVSLIKGGFPARFGGRLSSVVNISMKEGNNQKRRGEGSIGLLSSKLTLEGPINDKTTFLVSGRRTYLDILAKPFIAAASASSSNEKFSLGYFFHDVNAKVNHRFSDKDRVYLSFYTGQDKAFARYEDNSGNAKYKEDFKLTWGNITSALRWNHLINSKLFVNTTLTYSRYRFLLGDEYEVTFQDPEEEDLFFEQVYFSEVRDAALNLDLDYLPNPNHYMKFGINSIVHRFRPGVNQSKTNDEEVETAAADITALESSIYLEDDWKINRWLKVNMGVHGALFNVRGKNFFNLQPRISANTRINARTSLKASYSRMAQFIHLLTNSGVGLPTDLWVPATDRIAPQYSEQVSIGFAKELNAQLRLSIEGYYKTMDNVIEYKNGATFLNTDNSYEDNIEVGDGVSRGIELLLEKRQGKATGWIGYTLSRTTRQFDNLNFGEAFPYKFDRTHDISAVFNYDIGKNVKFSAAWVYGTGNATSLPTLKYNANVQLLRNESSFISGESGSKFYESRNAYRMPAFHRLDFSFSFAKDKKWGQRIWTVGLYNAYNRQNPFFIDYQQYYGDGGRIVQYSLLPMIPSISYQFKF